MEEFFMNMAKTVVPPVAELTFNKGSVGLMVSNTKFGTIDNALAYQFGIPGYSIVGIGRIVTSTFQYTKAQAGQASIAMTVSASAISGVYTDISPFSQVATQTHMTTNTVGIDYVFCSALSAIYDTDKVNNVAYKDGALIASVQKTLSSPGDFNLLNTVNFDFKGVSAIHFATALFSKELTDIEVAYIHSDGKIPASAMPFLEALYDFEGDEFTAVITDKSGKGRHGALSGFSMAEYTSANIAWVDATGIPLVM